jgi:hypothetical protein
MEWGTFIPVIIAVYLAWFGLNFLYDLFIGGKAKVQTESGITYNMSDLMAEEEKPQVISQKDFEHKTVEVHKTDTPLPAAPVASDADSSGQNLALPLAPKAPDPVAPEAPMPEDDWAGDLEREAEPEKKPEEKIDMLVQGQPVPVNDFIQSLKDQAKAETSAITF